MRLFVTVAVLTSFMVVGSVAGSNIRVAATANPLPTGSWGFCDSTHTVGCIESVYLTTPNGETTKYVDSSSLTSVGAQISATCTVAGQYSSGATSCDPTFAVANSGNPCPGYQPVFLMFDVDWKNGLDGSATLVVSTGTFEPSFTIGSGTTNVQVSQNDDGSFRYAWTTRIEEHHYSGLQPTLSSPGGTELYRESLKTAIAKSHSFISHVQVWPRQHLLRSSTEVILNSQSGTATCIEVPFRGAWAEANAESFSWNFQLGATDASTAAKLSFDARAPHFTFPDATGRSNVYAARIAVFLPRTYLDSIGCADVCDVPPGTIDVQAQDGQTATPKFTKLGDGLYVNMGIAHYSAPDPIMTIKRVGSPINRILPAKTSLEIPTVTVRLITPPVSVTTTKSFNFRTTTVSRLVKFAGLSVPKGARMSIEVMKTSSKVCRAVGTSLKALKSGTCKVMVRVSVTKGKRTTVTKKTMSLMATR